MRLDRRARDAVQLQERRLQLAGPDLDEVRHRLPPGTGRERAEHILARTEPDREEKQTWLTAFPTCRTRSTRSSRTSTRARWRSTTTSTTPAYVTNLNAALEGTDLGGAADRRDPRRASTRIPEDKRMAVRNNGGGHANHTLFWEIMGPNGGGEPSGALADAIAEHVRRRRRAEGGGERRRREALRLRLDLARLGRHRPRGRCRRRTRTRR